MSGQGQGSSGAQGIGDAVKGVFNTAHGMGETIRGQVNEGLDKFGEGIAQSGGDGNKAGNQDRMNKVQDSGQAIGEHQTTSQKGLEEIRDGMSNIQNIRGGSGGSGGGNSTSTTQP